MSRQSKCLECGQWYYNHDGQFIVLPDTYDDSKCPDCNEKIDREIKSRDNEMSYPKAS